MTLQQDAIDRKGIKGRSQSLASGSTAQSSKKDGGQNNMRTNRFKNILAKFSSTANTLSNQITDTCEQDNFDSHGNATIQSDRNLHCSAITEQDVVSAGLKGDPDQKRRNTMAEHKRENGCWSTDQQCMGQTLPTQGNSDDGHQNDVVSNKKECNMAKWRGSIPMASLDEDDREDLLKMASDEAVKKAKEAKA